MEKLIKSKEPAVILWKESLLTENDWLIIRRVNHMEKYTVLYDRREHIYINPAIEDSKRLAEVVKKIFADRLLSPRTEKLFDEVERMTDHQTMLALYEARHRWSKEVERLELNEQAEGVLKQIRSKRLYHKARRERAVIGALFDIGLGIYEEQAECDRQKGAENVFMYGYLLGQKEVSGA